MSLHLAFLLLGVSSLLTGVTSGDTLRDVDVQKRYREFEERTSAEIKELQNKLKELEDWKKLILGEIKYLRDANSKGNNSEDGKRDAPNRHNLQAMVTLIRPNSLKLYQSNWVNGSGAVYVRWGHHQCPPTSEKIYNGIAAGSNHRLSGGGADQLCLTLDPIYDEPVYGEGTRRAFIFALEYQIDDFPKYRRKLWHNVPCVVCKARSRRYSKLVIPGTNKCPSSEWTLEYGGYLMTDRSNHPVHQRSLHICVDREMDVLPGADGIVWSLLVSSLTSMYQTDVGMMESLRGQVKTNENNRGMLNLVEGRCSTKGGGIPCVNEGAYVDAFEITCAVCTI